MRPCASHSRTVSRVKRCGVTNCTARPVFPAVIWSIQVDEPTGTVGIHIERADGANEVTGMAVRFGPKLNRERPVRIHRGVPRNVDQGTTVIVEARAWGGKTDGGTDHAPLLVDHHRAWIRIAVRRRAQRA